MPSARSEFTAEISGTTTPQNPSATRGKTGFRIRLLTLVFSFLAFAAVSVRAEGPVLTLAMVSYDQLKPSVYGRGPFATEATRLFSRNEKSVEQAPAIEMLEPVQFPFSAVLDRMAKSVRSHPLFSARRNLRDYGLSRTWASFGAGYGRVSCYRPRTLYERNGGGWEEPTCGYLKLSFSF